mmetsp:Transcript_15928/g.25988  ORF Transcript_15928/g.25988 Transcript_15928/m.25988 type:complete len:221 (-) Transcript_15928:1789-2451(-)
MSDETTEQNASINEKFIAAREDMSTKYIQARQDMNRKYMEAEQAMEENEKRYCGDRVKVLSRVWIVTQVCTLILVITSFALGPTGSLVSFAFIGVWIAFLSVFLTIVGALILRKYRTPQHHGFLLGLSFMMIHMMLISAVVAGATGKCDGGVTAAEAVVCAISIALFFLYIIFTALLYKWRADIIATDEDDEEIEMHEGADLDGANGHDGAGAGGDLKMV